MFDLKFYDKYYIGFQKNRYDSTEHQRLLGFATPMDSTPAFTKRKETVDRWREKDIASVELENTPRFGFEIVDMASRYTTDNKLLRIQDPAGFELEISIANALHLIQTTVISKGQIMEPLVWARRGAANYLISKDSEEYKLHMNPRKATSFEAGQYFVHPAHELVVDAGLGKNLLHLRAVLRADQPPLFQQHEETRYLPGGGSVDTGQLPA